MEDFSKNFERFENATNDFLLENMGCSMHELVFSCNGLGTEPPELDRLLSLKGGMIMIFHVEKMDNGYIVVFPVDMQGSCVLYIMVITKTFMEKVFIDASEISYIHYFYFTNESCKFVYNYLKHRLYISGVESSNSILLSSKNYIMEATLRIYSIDLITLPNHEPYYIDSAMYKSSVHSGNLHFDESVKPGKNKYECFSPIPKYSGSTSFGLELLSELLLNDDRVHSEFLNGNVVYKPGLSNEDLLNIKKILELNWGIYVTNEAINQDFCKNFCVLFTLEDALLAVVYRTKETYPFRDDFTTRNGMVIFLNKYCYYIGRFTKSTSFSIWNKPQEKKSITYSLQDKSALYYREKTCSWFNYNNGKYVIHGDFRITCGKPIIMCGKNHGKATVQYIVNVPGVFKYFDNDSEDSLKFQFI